MSWNAALFGPKSIDPVVVGTNHLISEGLNVNDDVDILGPFVDSVLVR